jgi:EAL domain-containing protein (putative c-di-GMP-specific phosphodiesterase class I)
MLVLSQAANRRELVGSAEGIERQDPRRARRAERDMGQGFYLGRPLDGDARRFARRDRLAAAA